MDRIGKATCSTPVFGHKDLAEAYLRCEREQEVIKQLLKRAGEAAEQKQWQKAQCLLSEAWLMTKNNVDYGIR